MAGESIAATKFPDGLPGLLKMGEFCALMGVSKPTGLKIIKDYPEYVVKRGNANLVAIGLYQRLTHDQSVDLAPGVTGGTIAEEGLDVL